MISRDVQAASPPIGAGSPSAANEKLEKAVRAMFAEDEQLRKAELNVRADITKNEVTLSGTVESGAIRSRAVELAKTAHAGVVVNDKMTVKPPIKIARGNQAWSNYHPQDHRGSHAPKLFCDVFEFHGRPQGW